LTRPVVTLLLFSLLFSLWHLPGAFEAALRSGTLHNLEHVGLIVVAMLMWWPVMGTLPELPSLGDPGQILYLFVMPIGQFIVAAVLTFDPNPIYPTYIAAPRIWGLSAATDQQLGGIVMKAASLVAFGIPLAIAGFRWYRRENEPEAVQVQGGERSGGPEDGRGVRGEA
jgi:cytochrome c oxidase assembly factor CtaG